MAVDLKRLKLLRSMLKDAAKELSDNDYYIREDLSDLRIDAMNLVHEMLRLKTKIDKLLDVSPLVRKVKEGENALPKTI